MQQTRGLGFVRKKFGFVLRLGLDSFSKDLDLVWICSKMVWFGLDLVISEDLCVNVSE
jgi:hypothetical protein